MSETMAVIASAVSVLVSLSGIGYVWYTARANQRKANKEGTQADADASLTYGTLAANTGQRLMTAETEIAALKSQMLQMRLEQDRMVRYTAYLISVIDRLMAQLVSHQIEPVTRPISLEEFK